MMPRPRLYYEPFQILLRRYYVFSQQSVVLPKSLPLYDMQVVKRDLQLLAQVSQHSDDEYFTRFMVNLLSLFSADRRLLETRGSLIIRQLCLSLHPERMYRTFAEILEREEVV